MDIDPYIVLYSQYKTVCVYTGRFIEFLIFSCIYTFTLKPDFCNVSTGERCQLQRELSQKQLG